MLIFRLFFSQEKYINKNLKILHHVQRNTKRNFEPVETRPGIIYGFRKVPEKCVDDCSPFRPN